jgi:hypothetical protein
MNKLIAAVTTAVCWAGLCASASAFCVTDDAARGCPMPFASSDAAQPDGDSTRQSYDAQTGNQWSSASHKMDGFTFYSGMSSGNSWGNQRFGNGFNGQGLGSQNQAAGSHCAFYGDCP